MAEAKIFSLDIMEETVNQVPKVVEEAEEKCEKVLYECQRILEETQTEEKNSCFMLQEARAYEEVCLAEVATLAAGLPETAAELYRAEQEYERAKARRERLERRYEMAQQCVDIANRNLEETSSSFNYLRNDINNLQDEGLGRIRLAAEDLGKYIRVLDSASLNKVKEYKNYEYNEKNPITPDMIIKRLDLSKIEMTMILNEKYAKDMSFRNKVESYRGEAKSLENIEKIKEKLKKNLAGELGEEIVIRAFTPYGEKVETQNRYSVGEDGYTKVDLELKKLKAPIILGRGEGMGAREGGNLAIEVKTGKSQYIYSQKEHMILQSEGHKNSQVSCTICSKDIKDLSIEKETELRDSLKKAGSPLLGMLPKKEELDDVCIKFVLGE